MTDVSFPEYGEIHKRSNLNIGFDAGVDVTKSY
jgi:hypothetical protein